MTGINRALFEDERDCRKSYYRFIQERRGIAAPPELTAIPDDPNADNPSLYGHYCANTLYFLNSTENMNMEIELYDFEDTPEDPDNAVSIKEKKTVRVVVKGLGIPSNFTKTISIHPSLQITKEYGSEFGTEYGGEPIPVSRIEGISTYQVTRDNLGISEWESDSSEDSDSFKNRQLLLEYKKAWFGRLHGDIIDMAFYIEGT